MSRGIAITKLLKGQEIAVRAIARKGVGSLHAKWSPVATVTFHQEPEIFINEAKMDELTLSEKEAWVNSSLNITKGLAPTKVFKLDPNTQKVLPRDPPPQLLGYQNPDGVLFETNLFLRFSMQYNPGVIKTIS